MTVDRCIADGEAFRDDGASDFSIKTSVAAINECSSIRNYELGADRFTYSLPKQESLFAFELDP
jgi:hypothetical protein